MLEAIILNKTLLTFLLVVSCITFGWISRDEDMGLGDVDEANRRTGTWKSRGLIILILILLLALAS